MSKCNADGMKIFAGRASLDLARGISDHLDIRTAEGRTELFPDGELHVKIEEDVRGKDCFIVQSTSDPVNANLMELLIYIDCLRRASARRITAVIPYFGYARQDRKDEGRTPITAKLVANLITASGADRVLTMDLHAAQIQGFFDLPVDHLIAAPVFAEYVESIRDELGECVLLSPDVGNVKTANMYANYIGGDLAIIDKRRRSGSEVESANLVGDVKGKTVLMFDDMISTAGTICSAAEVVMKHGAKRVLAAATHAVLVGLAIERLQQSPIDPVVVSDTIAIGDRCKKLENKLKVLTVAPLLGEAIVRIHNDQSISALFKEGLNGKR